MQPSSPQSALVMASITGSAALSGVLATLSYISMPAILSQPDLPESTMLSLWQSVYFRGFHMSPPVAVSSGIACLTSVYLSGDVGSSRSKYLLTAAFLNISLIPFTIFVIAPTNKRLMARGAALKKKSAAKETAPGKGDDVQLHEESREMIASWAVLNYGRMLLPFGGMIMAWLAL